jgi:hypothetical protein
MRTVLIALAAATTLAAAIPASAQGVRLNGPGVEVDVGSGRHYNRERWRDRDYRYRGERAYNRGGCRTVTIQRDNGFTKQIRKCD